MIDIYYKIMTSSCCEISNGMGRNVYTRMLDGIHHDIAVLRCFDGSELAYSMGISVKDALSEILREALTYGNVTIDGVSYRIDVKESTKEES